MTDASAQPHADHDDHVCHHGPLGEHRAGTDAICLNGVNFAYNGTPVLEDVTLHIEAGCNLGIIGPNGGGKTTLLKIILGLIGGYRGDVQVMGRAPAEVCRAGNIVGYVPQVHEFHRNFPLSVRQVVRMGLLAGASGWLARPSREARQYAEHLMEQTGVIDLADRPIGDLSGGQQQRTFIARALAPRPSILLLDEPMVGIDLAGQRQFADLLHNLHQQLGLTVLVVSHDLRSLAAGCGKIVILNRRVHFHDAPDGITPQLLQEVFQHDIMPVLNNRA